MIEKISRLSTCNLDVFSRQECRYKFEPFARTEGTDTSHAWRSLIFFRGHDTRCIDSTSRSDLHSHYFRSASDSGDSEAIPDRRRFADHFFFFFPFFSFFALSSSVCISRVSYLSGGRLSGPFGVLISSCMSDFSSIPTRPFFPILRMNTS